MHKIAPWMILAILAAILATLSLCHADWLNDKNSFLRSFVNHELLATLGFIAAVTLASAASLHLELNRLEDDTGQKFEHSRNSIRRSAYSLLVLFGIAIILVVIKPLLPEAPTAAALANSAALLILYFYLSVMWDLTGTVLSIPTARRIRENRPKATDE